MDQEDKDAIKAFVLIMGLAVAACFVILEPRVPITKLERHVDLISMGDNIYITGSFHWGTGSINSGWQYTYYYDEGNGFLRLDSVDAEVTRIRVSATDPPTLDVFCTSWRGIWTGISLPARDSYGECFRSHAFAIAVIPPGSVVNEFKMDSDT
jgi:hypothetical protein